MEFVNVLLTDYFYLDYHLFPLIYVDMGQNLA